MKSGTESKGIHRLKIAVGKSQRFEIAKSSQSKSVSYCTNKVIFNMEHKLRQIPLHKYSHLQDVLLKRLPSSAMLLNTLQLQITHKLSTDIVIKFYATGENLDSSIIVAYGDFNYMAQRYVILFCMPANSSEYCEKLLTALDGFVDWGVSNLFGDVPDEVALQLIDLYRSKAGSGHHVDPDPCRFYWLDIPEAMQVKQVAEFDKHSLKTRPLNQNEAHIVNNEWDVGALQLIKDSILHVGSFGLFVNKSGDSGSAAIEELASWVVTTPLGSINALHTSDAHRRKGFGEIILRKIVHFNAEIGLRPVAHVRVANSTSQHLMEKVGLKFSHNTTWIQFGGLTKTE